MHGPQNLRVLHALLADPGVDVLIDSFGRRLRGKRRADESGGSEQYDYPAHRWLLFVPAVSTAAPGSARL